jgi:transposase-like protein
VIGPLGTKRVWSDEQKVALVAEYDAAPNGTKRRVLDHHVISYSHISTWREQLAKVNG